MTPAAASCATAAVRYATAEVAERSVSRMVWRRAVLRGVALCVLK